MRRKEKTKMRYRINGKYYNWYRHFCVACGFEIDDDVVNDTHICPNCTHKLKVITVS